MKKQIKKRVIGDMQIKKRMTSMVIFYIIIPDSGWILLEKKEILILNLHQINQMMMIKI